jgi:hypothetical protein
MLSLCFNVLKLGRSSHVVSSNMDAYLPAVLLPAGAIAANATHRSMIVPASLPDIRTLQTMGRLPDCILRAAMAGSVAAPTDLIASHLDFSHTCYALAPHSLPDSLAQTYRTLHPNSASSHWHHGQEQEQAATQKDQRPFKQNADASYDIGYGDVFECPQ